MRDQDLIDLALPRIPDEWRRKYLSRPIERLPADMNAAFDRIYKVEREKDQIRADNRSLRRTVHILLRSLIVISLVEFAVILVVTTIK